MFENTQPQEAYPEFVPQTPEKHNPDILEPSFHFTEEEKKKYRAKGMTDIEILAKEREVTENLIANKYMKGSLN